MKPRILVVDDEPSMRDFLDVFLTKEGYEVVAAPDGQKAVDLLDAQSFDLVITDLKMPKVDGIAVLKKARAVDPETQVLVITAFASHETAVDAMKAGAYDYFVKPFKVDEVRHFVANALERRRLSRENVALRQQLGERYGFGNLVGSDPRMLEIYDMIRRVADTPTNLLITGETGTGKELVARAVHANSPRAREPFVVINCGAIPSELLESELFGHKRGSFTGAIADKKGLFEIAAGGTIFLDEVAELPHAMQVKLLRALQQRTIMPIGSTRELGIDVRLISATNRNLEREVAENRFREDLYYRLNVIQIHMPPLRERRGDVPVLAEFFLEKYTRALGKHIRRISAEALTALKKYHFPGNVRELENIVERAVALERAEAITADSLPPHLQAQGEVDGRFRPPFTLTPQGLDLDRLLDSVERDFMTQALKLSGGSKKQAARLLGITFRSFRYRLAKLEIEGASSRDDGDGDDEED